MPALNFATKTPGHEGARRFFVNGQCDPGLFLLVLNQVLWVGLKPDNRRCRPFGTTTESVYERCDRVDEMKSYGGLNHGKILAALNFATKAPGHEGARRFFDAILNGVASCRLLLLSRTNESTFGIQHSMFNIQYFSSNPAPCQ